MKERELEDSPFETGKRQGRRWREEALKNAKKKLKLKDKAKILYYPLVTELMINYEKLTVKESVKREKKLKKTIKKLQEEIWSLEKRLRLKGR